MPRTSKDEHAVRELTESELASIAGGKVTVPEIKFAVSFADHEQWAEYPRP